MPEIQIYEPDAGDVHVLVKIEHDGRQYAAEFHLHEFIGMFQSEDPILECFNLDVTK